MIRPSPRLPARSALGSFRDAHPDRQAPPVPCGRPAPGRRRRRPRGQRRPAGGRRPARVRAAHRLHRRGAHRGARARAHAARGLASSATPGASSSRTRAPTSASRRGTSPAPCTCPATRPSSAPRRRSRSLTQARAQTVIVYGDSSDDGRAVAETLRRRGLRGGPPRAARRVRRLGARGPGLRLRPVRGLHHRRQDGGQPVTAFPARRGSPPPAPTPPPERPPARASCGRPPARVLFWALRLGLGGLFALTGALKMADPSAFAVEIHNYQLFPCARPGARGRRCPPSSSASAPRSSPGPAPGCAPARSPRRPCSWSSRRRRLGGGARHQHQLRLLRRGLGPGHPAHRRAGTSCCSPRAPPSSASPRRGPARWRACSATCVEAPRACSYLPGTTATLEHRVMVDVTADELGRLLERGWRRFGPDYFRPACPACSACGRRASRSPPSPRRRASAARAARRRASA